MEFITTINATRQFVRGWRGEQPGGLVGLVPTMGYFHEGHLKLMREARHHCGLVVVSLFVNPTQFGPSEDLEGYPRDIGRDSRLAGEVGVDVLFAPGAGELYPGGYKTYVEVEGLGDVLCGASRPGHFRGVTTVVTKLLNVVQPDQVFFGQKDAQQAIIIRRMLNDLDFPAEIIILPTERETDGLAMSSRNVYLSSKERQQAPVLYRALCAAQYLVASGERRAGPVRDAALAVLATEPMVEVEYLSIVSAESLNPMPKLSGPVLIAVAARLGGTRLIDNVLLEV